MGFKWSTVQIRAPRLTSRSVLNYYSYETAVLFGLIFTKIVNLKNILLIQSSALFPAFTAKAVNIVELKQR